MFNVLKHAHTIAGSLLGICSSSAMHVLPDWLHSTDDLYQLDTMVLRRDPQLFLKDVLIQLQEELTIDAFPVENLQIGRHAHLLEHFQNLWQ